MSNLHNTIEYINSLSQSDPKELIDRSEQRFKNIIRDVSDKVENDSGLQVVMLAGPRVGKDHNGAKACRGIHKARYENIPCFT